MSRVLCWLGISFSVLALLAAVNGGNPTPYIILAMACVVASHPYGRPR